MYIRTCTWRVPSLKEVFQCTLVGIFENYIERSAMFEAAMETYYASF